MDSRGARGGSGEPGCVSTTFLGFYDLDASPQRGLQGFLAERLGAATVDPDFIEGALFVRSDDGAVALSLRHDSDDAAWLERPLIATLIQSADFRSRTADVRSYRTSSGFSGVAIPDDAVFTIQRFDVPPAAQQALTAALESFVDAFARPILGFLDSEILASNDGERTVWVAPWAHEAALAALETPASFAAMRTFARLAPQRVFGTFDRVSYVRGGDAAG